MAGFLSRIFPFANPSDERAGQARPASGAAILADFLEDARKPRAIDPAFDSLLDRELRWGIAPVGTMDRLPLTADQREQYDFAAICHHNGQTLYLLDSRPVWAPGIPYIPSFLVVTWDDGSDTVGAMGTFDSKPDRWIFDWQSAPGATQEIG